MQPGSIIGGRYQLVDVVAEGGLSTVWQGVARSTEIFSRPVAVKVMKRQFAAVGGPYLAMFLEEARIGAQLQHANLIQVLDFIVETTLSGPVYCLVLEWVDGIDLKSMLKIAGEIKKPLPWPLVATIGVRVLRGLAAAHERKAPDGSLAPVLHRDCAPPNILLAANGDVKLADFGMALARDRIAEHTAPGFVKGTLSYMAPEIFHGKPASPASDLFSLAATLWEALANERLFQAASDAEVIDAIRKCEIPLIAERRLDVPVPLSAAIRRALSADPEQRYPTARAMANEIGDIVRTEGPPQDADEIVSQAVASYTEARRDQL
jgi:eukaryotic-like serine/threonine-protein kinase